MGAQPCAINPSTTDQPGHRSRWRACCAPAAGACSPGGLAASTAEGTGGRPELPACL